MSILDGETVSARAADMLRRFAEGERRFAGAHLSGADLTGADLTDADLRGADLTYADLRDADLTYADLRGADLRGATLTSATLGGADLRRADLRDADLEGADLGGADLGGANLMGADLGGANLWLADLWRADLGGADLRDADLPRDSHDMIAELLRRAADGDPVRESIAGFLLISRDRCWDDFLRLRDAFPPELVTWALDTLRAWPVYRDHLAALGVVFDADIPASVRGKGTPDA